MQIPIIEDASAICECGCGQLFPRFDARGRPRRFINGHNAYKYHGDKRPCTECGLTKPNSEFYKADGRPASICKSCWSQRGKAYYEKKQDIIKPRVVAWNKANPEQKRGYNHRRYRAQREKMLRQSREYRRTHVAERIAAHSAFEANRRGIEGVFTAEQWIELCSKYGNRCLKCGADGALSPDHINPLAKGGPNTIDNIQPLCASCNNHKHTSVVDYRPLWEHLKND